MRFERLLPAILASALSGACSEQATVPSRARARVTKDLVLAPTPLIDLNTTQSNAPGSEPSGFTPFAGQLYFVADDGVHGVELWRTDGTSAGTTPVVDLAPGLRSSNPRELMALGSHLYFSADDGRIGRELWRTDGTAAGTQVVRDLLPGAEPSRPAQLRVLGSALYFVATSREIGEEVFRSDGTPGGTLALADVRQGPAGSRPRALSVAGGGLLWIADDGTTGAELWGSSGAPGDARLIKDIRPGAASSFGANAALDADEGITVLGGAAYFAADDGLTGSEPWRSDGTPEGTGRVADVAAGPASSSPDGFVATSEAIYFAATAGAGRELYRVAGGAVTLVRDISAGPASSDPRHLVGLGALVLFSANDGTGGVELWRSDGTGAGTVINSDLAPGGASSDPASLTIVGDTLYFTAYTPTRGRELYRTNGSAPPTFVRDIGPFLWVPGPTALFGWNGTLYFAAGAQTIGRELYRSDGTNDGTVLVKDLRPSEASATPRELTGLGTQLVFTAYTNETGNELHISDGTPAGTRLLKDLTSGMPGDLTTHGPPGPSWLTPVGTRVFFSGERAPGRELWVTDGTPPGTAPVREVPLSGARGPEWLTNAEGVLFFTQEGATGIELYKSDGTSAGTGLVKDISAGAPSSEPSGLVALRGAVYFIADDGSHGRELWRSDGTSVGTVLVSDLHPDAASSSIGRLLPALDSIFFVATSPDRGRELWRTDGTSTFLVAEPVPGPGSSIPDDADALVRWGADVYFAATDAESGLELWRTDGTARGTTRVADLRPGGSGSAPSLLTPSEQVLLFRADDGTTGLELHRTDGTAEGTRLVRDIRPGPESGMLDLPPLALSPEGVIVFLADDGVSGAELWASDGTFEGTRPLGDLAPGVAPARVSELARVGGQLYIAASNGTSGVELFAAPVRLVADREPPQLSCPGSLQVDAPTAEGTTVRYPSAAVSDAVTPNPVLSYSHPAGSQFAAGITAVTVTARDEAGNESQCSFEVRVRDTSDKTPPQVTCPRDIVVESADPSGVIASYPPARATDATSTPQVTYAPPAGTRFTPGVTTITATATDAGLNTASCTFMLEVRPPDDGGDRAFGGCRATGAGPLLGFIALALLSWIQAHCRTSGRRSSPRSRSW